MGPGIMPESITRVHVTRGFVDRVRSRAYTRVCRAITACASLDGKQCVEVLVVCPRDGALRVYGESGMSAEDFQAALERCIQQINKLPESQRGRLMELVNDTQDRQRSVDDTLRQALDAIDDWRLQQKYMIFDMEARQREQAEQAQDDADADFTDDIDWI